MAAYVCARDQGHLGPTSDDAGVLMCPTCGHRTDAPGAGTLADGFDVTHRQWGLRADPHAWQAMRELVADTPTPASTDDVRAAYVDALRRVAGVDIDHTDAATVQCPDLDHGGMSGGSLDVVWWRTKGIPLLAERAIARRPRATAASTDEPLAESRTGSTTGTTTETSSSGSGGVKSVVVGVIVWLVVLALPAALIGGGVFLLYQRAVGTHVQATVVSCDSSGGIVSGASTYHTDCVATWEIDGREVRGAFTGGNGGSDVGKTVDATVRGDTAYSRSLGLPILLLALGLPFLALPAIAIRHRLRDRAASATSSATVPTT